MQRIAQRDSSLALALWALGSLDAATLPELGAYLLEDRDSPALRLLAGMTASDESWMIVQRFQESIDQLGLAVPPTDEAARLVAHRVWSELAGGRLKPSEAADYLMRISWSVDNPEFHDLDLFKYIASDYDEVSDDLRALWDAEILKEAARRASAGEPDA